MEESELLKQELEHYKSEKERVRKILGQIGATRSKKQDLFIKIILMISKQTRVEHFQFWILNSIEFQINLMSKKIRDIEDRVYKTQEPEQ